MERIIIRHTKFDSNPLGDGGSKRSAQIREILMGAGIPFEDEKFALSKFSLKDLVVYICRSFLFVQKTFTFKEIGSIKRYWSILKIVALRIPIIVDKYKNQSILFLWESTVSNNFAYPFLMKENNVPIIALPHNLESLVPTQKDGFSGKISPDWFQNELKGLSLCKAVFTISREECWLLKLYGINAFYLPYYPPKDVEKILLEIREIRQQRVISNLTPKILLLGSATNPPTYNGMLEMISLCKQEKPSVELHVGGFQTERLKDEVGESPQIILHGTLSDIELNNLLMNVDAVLIHQQVSTGALTRVPEMLIAGIPVLINADAARSNYEHKGLFIYNTDEQLLKYLREYNWSIPPMFVKQSDYIREFIDQVKLLSTI